MKQQKDVFMTLLTGLGAALGIITYFLCTFLFHKYETIGALLTRLTSDWDPYWF